MNSERLKTPKNVLFAKFLRRQRSLISLDSRFVHLENTGFRATLSLMTSAWLSQLVIRKKFFGGRNFHELHGVS